MLTIQSRNERYIGARIKRAKAQSTVERAEAALAKVADLDAEITWLAAAPVKDAPKDENGDVQSVPLPSDEDIAAVAEQRNARLRAKRGGEVDDDAIEL